MDSIFSVKNTRVVNNDFTIKFKGNLFQRKNTACDNTPRQGSN